MLFKIKYSFYYLLLICGVLFSCGVKKSLKDKPDISAYEVSSSKKIQYNDSLFFKDENSFRKNRYKQWELVVSGNPLEIGNTTGELSEELIKSQEEIFFSKVEELVPSKFKQALLNKFLAYYNRKMYLHIKEEYKIELLGISKYSSDKYDYIADKYLRAMYLHGAHDIGHAMQDLALVGCSSFAVWGVNTVEGDLIIARNFDFYAGDEFAKEKVISFIKPNSGYKFVSISWPGMIGVMSGMNEKGLTVTINAGKSDMPFVAKTPISLVTREILQYASNIEEAIEIAKNREVFVSESIMVGSAIDNKAILIETSPNQLGIYDVKNSSILICSNHFQGETYQFDDNNNKQKNESHSMYRYARMEELLNETEKVTPRIAVDILRNKDGLNNKKIGYGNEKALNQLLAHHSVVFQPKKRMVWVSSNPYQLGEFVAYQLDSVFASSDKKTSSLSMPQFLISKDTFQYSQTYLNYEKFRNEKKEIQEIITTKKHLSNESINQFISLNPDYWEVYYYIGKYYYDNKYYRASLNEFEKALTKEITTIPDKEVIEKYIKKIKRKLNDS